MTGKKGFFEKMNSLDLSTRDVRCLLQTRRASA